MIVFPNLQSYWQGLLDFEEPEHFILFNNELVLELKRFFFSFLLTYLQFLFEDLVGGKFQKPV